LKVFTNNLIKFLFRQLYLGAEYRKKYLVPFLAPCDGVRKYKTIKYQQSTLLKTYLLRIQQVSPGRHQRGSKMNTHGELFMPYNIN